MTLHNRSCNIPNNVSPGCVWFYDW